MKLKQLQALLEDVEAFEEPKIALEQFATGAHIAARILHVAHGLGDVEDRAVVDLGCGCGVLGIAAVLMGAGHVVRLQACDVSLGVDVDDDALAVAVRNCAQFEDLHIDFLRADVTRLPARVRADTVITNPPFGTRRKGADTEFLLAASAIARRTVYSLHKTSTREHVQRYAERSLGMGAQVVAQLRYDLPASYAFHRSASKDVEVDLWRLTKQPQSE